MKLGSFNWKWLSPEIGYPTDKYLRDKLVFYRPVVLFYCLLSFFLLVSGIKLVNHDIRIPEQSDWSSPSKRKSHPLASLLIECLRLGVGRNQLAFLSSYVCYRSSPCANSVPLLFLRLPPTLAERQESLSRTLHPGRPFMIWKPSHRAWSEYIFGAWQNHEDNRRYSDSVDYIVHDWL